MPTEIIIFSILRPFKVNPEKYTLANRAKSVIKTHSATKIVTVGLEVKIIMMPSTARNERPKHNTVS